jgi:hypothetical protein
VGEKRGKKRREWIIEIPILPWLPTTARVAIAIVEKKEEGLNWPAEKCCSTTHPLTPEKIKDNAHLPTTLEGCYPAGDSLIHL